MSLLHQDTKAVVECLTSWEGLRRDMRQAVVSAHDIRRFMQHSEDAADMDEEVRHLMLQLGRNVDHFRKYLRWLQREGPWDIDSYNRHMEAPLAEPENVSLVF